MELVGRFRRFSECAARSSRGPGIQVRERLAPPVTAGQRASEVFPTHIERREQFTQALKAEVTFSVLAVADERDQSLLMRHVAEAEAGEQADDGGEAWQMSGREQHASGRRHELRPRAVIPSERSESRDLHLTTARESELEKGSTRRE